MRITILNETFKILKSSTKEGNAIINDCLHPYHRYDDIFDAYGKPSTAKQNIWKYWCISWANQKSDHYKIDDIWISSRNTSTFTINFIGYDTETDATIYGKITKAYNKVVII